MAHRLDKDPDGACTWNSPYEMLRDSVQAQWAVALHWSLSQLWK